MLTKIFTIELTSSQTIPIFGNNIPNYTCLYYTNTNSKHVFCVDASIDVQQICADNGIIYEYIHDLEVLPEEYNNTYTVGTDMVGSNIYHLIFFKKNVNPFPDSSMNIPMKL